MTYSESEVESEEVWEGGGGGGEADQGERRGVERGEDPWRATGQTGGTLKIVT